MPPRHRLALPLAAAHALFMFAWCALRHAAYGSRAHDLGAYHQIFFNASRGSLFNEIEGFHQWSAHFEVGLVWLAGPYRLYPTPLWLLATQAIACAASGLVVERLARRALTDPRLALWAMAAALVTPQLLLAEHYDFHSITVCTLPLAVMALGVEEDRPATLALGALVAMSIREQMGLALVAACAAWCLRHGLTRRRALVAAALSALGLGVFAAEVLWIIPSYAGPGPRVFRYVAHYARLGQTPGAVARFALTHPLRTLGFALAGERKTYLLELASGAVLPTAFGLFYFGADDPARARVRRVWAAARRCLWPLVFAAPLLAIQLLSAHPPTFSIHFQYGAPLVPLVAAGAIAGARELESRARGGARLAILAWLVATSLHALVTFVPEAWDRGGPLDVAFFRSPRAAALSRATSLVPIGAYVSAQDAATPHLSGKVRRWPDDADRADYVLLDERGDPLASPETIRAAAAALRRDPGLRVMVDDAGVLLARRQRPGADL
jgi:uncharacterized membrane protein